MTQNTPGIPMSGVFRLKAHSFAENTDYPEKSDEWLKYVNSRMRDGKIEIIYRDLVTGGKTYEHSDSER